MITLDELRDLKFFNDPGVKYDFFPCQPGGNTPEELDDFLRDKNTVYVEYHLPYHGVDIPHDGFVAFYRN